MAASADPPAPAAPRPRFVWTWPRVVLSGFFVSVFAIAGVIVYDEPLKPVDDLALAPQPDVPAAENGWEYLRVRWESLPKFPVPQREKLTAILDGTRQWDESDEDLTKIAADGQLRLAELREALALPAWQAPVPESMADVPMLSWLTYAVRPMDALELQLVHTGRQDEAIAILCARIEASRRGFASAPTLIHFLVHAALCRLALGVVPGMLASAAPPGDGWCLPLQHSLSGDWLTPEILTNIYRGEAQLSRGMILALPSGGTTSRFGDPAPWYLRAVLKPQKTANRCADYQRVVEQLWLVPLGPARHSIPALNEDREGTRKWTRALGGNFMGESMVDDSLFSSRYVDLAARKLLFLQRAMAVRIALHRWKLAHGSLPGKLAELVPDFLAAVPEDPFDGRPLRWDPTRFGGMVYSVGQDLTDDPARSFNDGRQLDSWIDKEDNSMAIRLELPPPPPVRKKAAAPRVRKP